MGNALAQAFGFQNPVAFEEEIRKQLEIIARSGQPLVPIQRDITKLKDDTVNLVKSSKFRKLFVSDGEFFLDFEEDDALLNRLDVASDLTPLMACAALGRTECGQKLIEKGAAIETKNTVGATALLIACVTAREDFVEMLLKRKASVNVMDRLGITALCHAILSGNEEIVKMLLQQDVDIHACAPDGNNAISVASEKGMTDIVELLIEAKSDVNSCNVDGWTPLMKCAQFNDTKTLELLIEKQANVQAVNLLGNTALHICASHGHMDSLEILLKDNFGVNKVNKFGHTALMLASSKGSSHMVDILLKNGASKSVNAMDTEGKTALFFAALRGDKHIVELLLDAKADPDLADNRSFTPLMCACQEGHATVVNVLLKQKNDKSVHCSDKSVPGSDYFLALFKAVQNKRKQVVKTMLSRYHKILSSIDVKSLQSERYLPILHTAAASGDKSMVQMILNAGADVNSLNNLNQTSVFVSALSGHNEIVRLLIEKHADVNITDRNGDSPLIIASAYGHKSVVKTLLEGNASVATSNLQGRTALMEAASIGNLDIVKLLQPSSCDVVDYKEATGWTALMLASQLGHISIVKYLLDTGASYKCVSRYRVNALMISSGNGKEEIASTLLARGASVNEKDIQGYTPLLHAAVIGHARVVDILIRNKADVKVIDIVNAQSPLEFAAFRGNADLARLLIIKGANVNSTNRAGLSPLHVAAINKHQEVVEILLKANAEVDKHDMARRTALMYAAANGDSESVRHLLKHGAKGNLQSSDGWTPLMLCSQHGFTECMQILLDNNVDVDVAEARGHTALNICAANGRRDAVCLLLSKKADPDLANQLDQTPLMLSAGNGHLEIVRNLVKYASLELKDNEGKTALIVAAEKNRVNVLKVLIEAKAKINAVTRNKLTALHLSSSNGHFDAVRELINQKADLEKADLEGNTPLLSCAQKSTHWILGLLLCAGADAKKQNLKGQTALQISVTMNCEPAVQHLLERCSMTESEKTALVSMAKNLGHTKIVKMIQQCDINACRSSQAGVAAGSLVTVKAELEDNCAVNRMVLPCDEAARSSASDLALKDTSSRSEATEASNEAGHDVVTVINDFKGTIDLSNTNIGTLIINNNYKRFTSNKPVTVRKAENVVVGNNSSMNIHAASPQEIDDLDSVTLDDA